MEEEQDLDNYDKDDFYYLDEIPFLFKLMAHEAEYTEEQWCTFAAKVINKALGLLLFQKFCVLLFILPFILLTNFRMSSKSFSLYKREFRVVYETELLFSKFKACIFTVQLHAAGYFGQNMDRKYAPKLSSDSIRIFERNLVLFEGRNGSKMRPKLPSNF